MGKRDDLDLIKGMVEYGKAYVEKTTNKIGKYQLKRGKGSQKQAIVAVASESAQLEDPDSGKRSRHCGFFKLKLINGVTKESIEKFVAESVDPQSVLFTDKNTATVDLEKLVEEHIKVKSSPDSTNENLDWVYTAISNLKINLLGIYHMVSEKYLQNYLNDLVTNSTEDTLVINSLTDWLLLQLIHPCNIPSSHFFYEYPLTFK